MSYIICGLHRSGTTFVGEILKRAGVTIIHEPLNERFGMVDVPIAYPFCEKQSDTFKGLLDDAIDLRRPWNKDVTYIRGNELRRNLYAMTGGRSGLKWGLLRLRRALSVVPRHICLKDPFMSLATPYLVKEHGLKVVCMVRHPSAIHYSTEKQNWQFDVDNLLRQPELVTRYGKDISNDHWELARNNPAASIAILWKLMVRINLAVSQNDERLLMITHEDICFDPLKVANKICSHFGIPFSLSIEQFVIKHSFGGSVEAKNGKTHDFKRDSRAIPDSWRGKLTSSDEEMIYQIAGKEVQQYYGAW
ncbi:MAG: sulfotransferase domain-containing protein [Gammaproteobacteria bacterium]|nr:sulfotransferase domain-containing protein [Gammaproteobacteria bacterium]